MNADNGVELNRIAWSQAFPFVRLFKTLRLALDFKRLVLGLAAVVLVYLGGGCLDWLWGSQYGVRMSAERDVLRSEIAIYATQSPSDFALWGKQAQAEREVAAMVALSEAGIKITPQEVARRLEKGSVRAQVLGPEQVKRLATLRRLVHTRYDAGRQALEQEPNLPPAERRERLTGLTTAADQLLVALSTDVSVALPAADYSGAILVLLGADPKLEATQRNLDQDALKAATTRQAALQRYERTSPQGPFRAWLHFQMQCFAGAVHGVCTGHWGFAGHALAPAPSLAGSILSALRGSWWLVHFRPCYFGFFTLWSLAVLAFFGGAICRSAAVQAARDESITLGAALTFAKDKFSGFVLAPLMPLMVLAGIAALTWIGGVVGAIPNFEFITAIAFPLALLGGLVMALVLLAVLLGFHLMWPTIAAEGSDGFDALSRACSYVGSRIWHVFLYGLVLLVYGAFSFVLVRLVVVLLLKLAHTCTKSGMGWLGSNSELVGMGKFEALWRMPAWSELWALPTATSAPFWGTFHNGPLDLSEGGALFFLRLWVYLVVGLVMSFVLCFFFSGSTQMYFLLRRDVDATDYDEVYYEEPEGEDTAAVAAAAAPTAPPADNPAPPAESAQQ